MVALNAMELDVARRLIERVVASRGEGFDWLDDTDRAEIAAAIEDRATPGHERFERVVAVVDRKVTQDDVTRFLDEGG